MKGGVGKTTLTINIAKRLSNMDNRVLVVDMDPQFNATQSLLLYRSNNRVLFIEEDEEELLREEKKSSEFYDNLSKNGKTALQMFESSKLDAPLENKSLVQKITENLDLIPGDLTLAKEISGDTASKVGVLLSHFEKNNMLNDYEYILIDCPPTWSILTHASLFASDYYVIPSKVDLYSSIGIKLLEQQIERKILGDTLYALTKRSLKRLGVVFTLVHRTIVSERERKQYLKEEFDDIDFFNNDLPYMPSIPTRFIMYEEAAKDNKYSELINSIEKITNELISKL